MATDIPKLNILSTAMSAKYKNLVLVMSIITLVGLGVAAFSFYEYSKTQKELQAMKKLITASQKTGNDQLSKIITEVGKIIKLPEGEVPTMATISDISKLNDQAFFKNGKNGNVLLVYSQAGKAILYDPVDKKIVEIAPVNSNGSPAPATQIKPKVALRNGTSTPGVATKTEGEVKKAYPEVNITLKDNASKNTYDKTAVILLNEAMGKEASILSRFFDASITSLPKGESVPSDVDILVILGKDRT